MAGGSEMAFGHEGHHQLPLAERIQYALRFSGGASLHGQAPRLGGVGDEGVVRTLSLAPAAILVGPLCHFYRVNNVVRQRGHHDGHRGGAAAVTADIVGRHPAR